MSNIDKNAKEHELAIDITHLGEALFAKLFTENPDLLKIALGNFYPEIIEETNIDVQAEVALEAKAGTNSIILDGCSRIDVALFIKDECIPIELKLGKTRIDHNKLKDCKFSAHKESKKRLSGSMMSILEHLGFENCVQDKEIELYVHQRAIPVSRKWFLIVRTDKIAEKLKNKWKSKDHPKLPNCTIISADTIFNKNPQEFNRAVQELVTSDDYYSAWFEK